MKTKLVKKLGVLALCGTLFCNAFGVTANATEKNDYLARTMSWDGNKCTVTTQGYALGVGCYPNSYVFVYNSSGALLGSASKNSSSNSKISKAVASVKKSKTKTAKAVHYMTSGSKGAGTVYGYVKVDDVKKGTPY